MSQNRASTLLASATLFAAACGGPIDPGGESSPEPEPLPAAAIAPRYALTTDLGAGATLVMPDEAYQTVEALRMLSTNPARTLFELAEVAGVPAVEEIRGALPQLVMDAVEGFLNDAILNRAVQATPVPQRISELADAVAAPLAHVELDTTLAFDPPDASGVAQATHTLDAVVFQPVSSQPVRVPPELAQVVGSDRLSAKVEKATAPGEDGRLTLGEHAFGLPVGRYAVVAADVAADRVAGGGSLRGAIGALVDCSAAAAQVAARCVGPVCVGHEGELTTICERGLDLAVDEVHDRMRELDVNAIHFLAGQAILVDRAGTEPADSVIDRMDAGTWVANANVGLGERRVEATFTGRRAP